jgi:RNA polymerase sigma-70 factor (ECF subfamily)
MDGTTSIRIQGCLNRLKAGEESARDELLTVAENRLHVLTQKMFWPGQPLRKWEEEDDVFQEAALKLWRSLKAVTPATPYEFFGLAALQIRRTLIDLYRRVTRRKGFARFRSLPAGEGAQAFDFPDKSCSPRDLESWVSFHEEVDKLDEPERAVVDLVFYHDCLWSEVAELLAIPGEAAINRWESAKKKLKRALEKSEKE